MHVDGSQISGEMEKGSSSSSSLVGGGADSMNGLQFGQRIYLGSGLHPPPSTSPAKKGRTEAPRCQVEGCTADLSHVKAYYCRHKVCAVHSKSPKVIVAGIEQRFCQQCSRFHQLPEFDQGKRSCRRRLAGHNERRRKPPPGHLLSSSYDPLSLSTYDNNGGAGSFVIDFSSYSSNVAGINSWPNIICDQPSIHPWTSTSHYPLPNFLEGPNPRPGIPPEGCFNSNPRALSLLSSPSWGSRAQPQALGLGTSEFAGPSDSIGQFSWAFKGDGSMHDMAPEVGLAAFSQSSNSRFSGGVGLVQSSDNRYEDVTEGGYESSAHHMHW